YDAHGGYNGTRLTFYTNRRFDHSWFGFFARYDTLAGATFEDSPLVKQKSYFFIGALIASISTYDGEK
ncbi:MAG: MipA/OmpV family protein, partial [Proteobacteria bacterium]|nr:MipA/OmpV family protein [Pseudomonadota bacterium]